MVQVSLLSIAVMSVASMAGYSANKRKSEMVERPTQTHFEALALRQKVEQKLDSVRKTVNDPPVIKTVGSLANLVELWVEGLIEVPGFEHEHGERGHAEHQHKPSPQMTEESMLEFQTIAKEAIQLIESEADKQFNQN